MPQTTGRRPVARNARHGATGHWTGDRGVGDAGKPCGKQDDDQNLAALHAATSRSGPRARRPSAGVRAPQLGALARGEPALEHARLCSSCSARWRLAPMRAMPSAWTARSGAAAAAPGDRVNLALALVSPDGLRPVIVNWEEVALHFLRGVQGDALADATPETAALLERLLAVPGVAAVWQAQPPDHPHAPVLNIHFRRGEHALRLFTTIATLGTPHDVTLQEIRIECFFPADDATATVFRQWASSASRDGA